MTATIPKYRLFIAENFWSLFGAGFLLFFDVVLDGSFLLSIAVCPIWFLVSLIRNGIVRPGRRLVFFRIAIPALTLGIALANTFIQWTIADINSNRIVSACEAFQFANGRYPQTLSELVSGYLPSIPRAKYCIDDNFRYANLEGRPILWWDKFGFSCKIYSFERKEWGGNDSRHGGQRAYAQLHYAAQSGNLPAVSKLI